MGAVSIMSLGTLIARYSCSIAIELIHIYFIFTSWKPVLRKRIEQHLEAMYPHIPIYTVTNPSPQ
jgi:hypothetical protein